MPKPQIYYPGVNCDAELGMKLRSSETIRNLGDADKIKLAKHINEESKSPYQLFLCCFTSLKISGGCPMGGQCPHAHDITEYRQAIIASELLNRQKRLRIRGEPAGVVMPGTMLYIRQRIIRMKSGDLESENIDCKRRDLQSVRRRVDGAMSKINQAESDRGSGVWHMRSSTSTTASPHPEMVADLRSSSADSAIREAELRMNLKTESNTTKDSRCCGLPEEDYTDSVEEMYC